MNSIVHYIGFGARATRTKDNDLYIFATDSHTTRGKCGAQLYFSLCSEDQDTVANFIALEFQANNCYIYSIDSMEETITENSLEEYEIYKHVVTLPLDFGK